MSKQLPLNGFHTIIRYIEKRERYYASYSISQ
jgi:hypothetical protein